MRTEPRRGALQHFYRATARPALDQKRWRRLPAGLRRQASGETLQGLVGELAAAADAGQLEDPELVIGRTLLELDQRGFNKLNRLLARTMEQTPKIVAESAARSDQGAGTVPNWRSCTSSARSRARGPAEIIVGAAAPRAPSRGVSGPRPPRADRAR